VKKLIKIDSALRDKNTRLANWGLKPIPFITVFGSKEVIGHELMTEGPAWVHYEPKPKAQEKLSAHGQNTEDCWIETDFPVILFNKTNKTRERIE